MRLGDIIDLSGIDADPILDGDQAFILVKQFTAGGTTLQVRLDDYLSIDLDHDGSEDIAIEFYYTGGPQPTAADIVL